MDVQIKTENIYANEYETENDEMPVNIKEEPSPEHIPSNISGPIPQHFFDDLIAQESGVSEVKYADVLNQNNKRIAVDNYSGDELQPRLEQESKPKKHKHKSKKRKREKSRNSDENPPAESLVEIEQQYSQTNSNCFQIDDKFPLQGFKKIKLEKRNDQNTKVETEEASLDEKKHNAIAIAFEVIEALKNSEKLQHMKKFHFTSVVAKIKSEELENRSPLNMINNVTYNFNSITSKLNLNNWHLEKLSKNTAKIAKIIAIDAEKLRNKIAKSKFTHNSRQMDQENDSAEPLKSSFFTNAMTQTDDMECQKCNMRSRSRGFDISVQAKPETFEIGSQTRKTNDDLPLMKIIDTLNENQLLALNDFAELIRAPASNSTIGLYEKRTQVWSIFQMSQNTVPSANAPAWQPPVQQHGYAPHNVGHQPVYPPNHPYNNHPNMQARHYGRGFKR